VPREPFGRPSKRSWARTAANPSFVRSEMGSLLGTEKTAR
jgi:hypothetical protein